MYGYLFIYSLKRVYATFGHASIKNEFVKTEISCSAVARRPVLPSYCATEFSGIKTRKKQFEHYQITHGSKSPGQSKA